MTKVVKAVYVVEVSGGEYSNAWSAVVAVRDSVVGAKLACLVIAQKIAKQLRESGEWECGPHPKDLALAEQIEQAGFRLDWRPCGDEAGAAAAESLRADLPATFTGPSCFRILPFDMNAPPRLVRP